MHHVFMLCTQQLSACCVQYIFTLYQPSLLLYQIHKEQKRTTNIFPQISYSENEVRGGGTRTEKRKKIEIKNTVMCQLFGHPVQSLDIFLTYQNPSFWKGKLFCKNCERTVIFEIVSAFEWWFIFSRQPTAAKNSVLSF